MMTNNSALNPIDDYRRLHTEQDVTLTTHSFNKGIVVNQDNFLDLINDVKSPHVTSS
jgi:hypothetical protein